MCRSVSSWNHQCGFSSQRAHGGEGGISRLHPGACFRDEVIRALTAQMFELASQSRMTGPPLPAGRRLLPTASAAWWSLRLGRRRSAAGQMWLIWSSRGSIQRNTWNAAHHSAVYPRPHRSSTCFRAVTGSSGVRLLLPLGSGPRPPGGCHRHLNIKKGRPSWRSTFISSRCFSCYGEECLRETPNHIHTSPTAHPGASGGPQTPPPPPSVFSLIGFLSEASSAAQEQPINYVTVNEKRLP